MSRTMEPSHCALFLLALACVLLRTSSNPQYYAQDFAPTCTSMPSIRYKLHGAPSPDAWVEGRVSHVPYSKPRQFHQLETNELVGDHVWCGVTWVPCPPCFGPHRLKAFGPPRMLVPPTLGVPAGPSPSCCWTAAAPKRAPCAQGPPTASRQAQGLTQLGRNGMHACSHSPSWVV